jgi:hypothetical protein
VGELVVFPAIYFVWRGIGLKRTPLFESNEETNAASTEEGENQ